MTHSVNSGSSEYSKLCDNFLRGVAIIFHYGDTGVSRFTVILGARSSYVYVYRTVDMGSL